MRARMPIHPRTGQRAIFVSNKTGRIYWPIMGGDASAEAAAQAAEAAKAQGTDAEAAKAAEAEAAKAEAALGEAGKKALDTERSARKAAEKQVAELQAAAAKPAESANDLDAMKAEIRGEFAVTLAEMAIKGEAKGRLNDPADALLYLKPADLVGKDEAAIRKAVDKLLKDRPYLAAPAGAQPWGDVGAGQRTETAPEPSTPHERLTRAYSTS